MGWNETLEICGMPKTSSVLDKMVWVVCGEANPQRTSRVQGRESVVTGIERT